MTLSIHQRNSKYSQPHSCMKVTDASQPNNEDNDRFNAASNLMALKND